MLFIVSLVLLCSCPNGLAVTVDDFATWTPDSANGTIYCESIRGTGSQGGVACGATSYAKMKISDAAVGVQTVMGKSLGLLNIAWIARAAYTTQRDFYQTCKPYFIRLYDGLYKDFNKVRCVTGFPTPQGLDPACNDTSNTVMKSGSGYCMSQQVCGATVPIVFLKEDSNNGTWLAWATGITSYGSIKPVVGKCYGYESKTQSSPLDATILANKV